MDYKAKLEEIKALVFGSEKKEEVKDVKLAEDAPEQKEVAEEAPAPSYVTLEQFNALKDEQKTFMESVTEMLSKAMEMINSTEKNAVPEGLSKEKKEKVEVEEVELAAEPLKHNPESLEKNPVANFKISAGRKTGTGDVVMQRLFGENADLSIYTSK